MDSAKTFELKVGIFIMIGIAILFFIVFSVGEINFSKTGYKIKVLFNFANGIGPTAPVRLAPPFSPPKKGPLPGRGAGKGG